MKIISFIENAPTKLSVAAKKSEVTTNNILYLDVLIFSIDGIDFAIKLTNVGAVRNNYPSIFQYFDAGNSLFGFILFDNELANIIDINSIINIPNRHKNKILLEILKGNQKALILIDDNKFKYSKIKLPFENYEKKEFNHISKVINYDSQSIYLINEISIFNEIELNIK
ncbi:MAG: hypothetical protein LBO69_08450 [Ignavibacteria bacterium]|jgi:chemotaxis signal transduction protein|nr:hypothetical protein [Ignavibacteria bacterium]